MEEKKKKKQEEKSKKEAAQKKVAEQKTKVPDSAKPSPSLHPANPSLTLSLCAASSSGNGKRAPSSAQQQQQQQQQQQPTPGPRYPPREVPPRFRQQEHKQLLKRGQPLPAGTLPLASSSSSSSSSSASTQLGTSSPPQTPSSKRHTELSHLSGLGAQYENPLWGLSNKNSSSSTGWDQVIIDENDSEAWPSISVGSSHAPPECPADADRSSDGIGSSSMSMATGAGQPAHYPISNKNSINHSASMVSSQGGPNRGWGPEGKADGLTMGGRGQPSWGTPNLNLNPNANPAAWPMLGHEGPNVGGGGGGMGGSNSLPPNMCGPGGAPSAHGPNGNGNMGSANGNLMGDSGTSAWGNPDASEQHQSPAANVSFSMEPPNLNTDGPNHTKQEPMSPVHSWGGQSPTESSQVNGDGTAMWGSSGGDGKAGEPKDSGWDSGNVSWGGGGAGNGGGGGTGTWGNWEKQQQKPSGEASGWNSADVPPQDQMSSWTGDAPASEGSGDSSDGRSQRRERSSSIGKIPLLPRQDLDPRVLSNSGWGQTPVRQHTVWEMEEIRDHKSESGTEGWGSSSSATPAGPPPMPAGGANPNLGGAPRPDSGGKNEPAGPVGSASGWGGAPPPPKQSVTGWGEPPASKKVSNGSVSGWGEPVTSGPNSGGPKSNQSWGSEEKSPSWEDGPAQPKQQGWGDNGSKPSQSWGNGGSSGSGEWGDSSEVKKNGTGNPMWEGEGSNWKENPRSWSKPAPSVSAGPGQGWGGKPQEGPNGGGGNGGSSGSGGTPTMGSWGGPNTVKQTGSGWGSGGRSDSEATGWEEPSPPSIRRKMEIDDGTSTWGDPSAYSKAVNMWDRNNPVAQGNSGPGNNGGGGNNSGNNHSASTNNNHHHHPHHNQPHHNQPPMQNHSNGSNNNGSPNQPGPPQNRPPLVTPGWGDLPNVQAKPEPSSWGEPASNAPAVDNGTSAWGKPPRGCGGWGDGGHEPTGPYGRGNAPPGPAPCKQAPKSMQDGWGSGGDDMGMSSGQWEADDGDMWNSPASQESNSSCNSWGNLPKKVPPKGKMPNKQDDTWIMNRLIKQLTDMGFPRDPAEEALKSNNMNLDQAMSALLEKKTELDKRGMGMSDYNGLNKPMVCRPPALSKDSSSDRAPFLDKDGGLSDDTPTSPFMPSPGLKLPLANSSLPGHGLVGVSSGLAMQNLNNRQMQNGMFGSSGAAQARALQQPPQAPPPQPSVPPLSSSQPALRTQVPQFLSPQVQAQLLQFAAKNIGLNPALLTSPINPQQMTLLYQLQQLQMAYQRLQIQQQMMQAQRSVSGPIRQQEQQVARTINNMQQQIQQHQRQLAQALLMKQQPPPPHSGLHPAAGKSALDSFPGHPQASGLNDLQTKEPQSSPNSYSTYPLSGLNPSMNVNCMEVGGLSMKDPPQPQSRLSQWTHANSMDSLPGNGSHMEPGLNKHGGIPPAPNHGPTGKTPMDDSYSPYGLMSTSESPTSPLGPPESWTQGKSPTEKISNGTNISWPPEFCPGVPWKGLQNIDPENDPNMTPGSVPSGPTINTNIQDVHRYLQRDRSGGSSPTSSQSGSLPASSEWPVSGFTSSFSLSPPDGEDATGKLLDMKSTWSPGPISHTQASLSHELWKVPPGARNTTAPSRPPPGLTNTKPSSTWGGHSLGLAPGWNSSSYSDGTTWSTDSSNRTSSWLVLRNLTPQIDGSTLRTLCMQHGPLITFHLNLTQGNAVVRYSSKEEAAKAQKSLHMCVLGNTTILAEFAGEEEVNRFFAQGQSLTPTTSWQANPGTNQTRLGGAAASHAVGHGHWSGGSHAVGHGSSGGGGGSGVVGGGAGKAPGSSGGSAGGAGGSNDLLWGGVQQYSSLWGPPGGDDARVIGSPIPINTLLPGDLLSGESM